MRDRLLSRNAGTFRITGFLLILWLLAALPAGSSEVPKVAFTVEEFAVEGDNPLPAWETRMVLMPFLGEHDGLAGLEAGASALETVIKEKGYAFHRVTIPPQQLAGGKVVLRISAFEIGLVTVEGNQRYSEDTILASLPLLESGKTINTLKIARLLEVVNEHPARKTSVFFRQGEIPETIDVRVKVAETRPLQFFGTLTNTGDAETGRMRLSLGAQHSNLFKKDHSATLTYSTSPQYVSDVVQVGMHYQIPLYRLASRASIFYSHSEVDQGLVADFFDVSGKGNFGGISVDHTLLPVGAYSHKISLGIQDRLFENDTEFSGSTIGLDVRTRPVSFRYTGRLEKTKGIGSFYLDYVRNLTSGVNNDATAYNAARAGADTDWHVLRYGADLDLLLPKKWRFRGRLSGQETGDILIPGEQFGIGGSRSVRGYEEREISGDSGEQISLEVWAPPLPYRLHMVGFLDAGWLRLENPGPGQNGDDFIAGTGLGIRWFWKRYTSLSLDAAVALDKADTTDAGDCKVHLNLLVRY